MDHLLFSMKAKAVAGTLFSTSSLFLKKQTNCAIVESDFVLINVAAMMLLYNFMLTFSWIQLFKSYHFRKTSSVLSIPSLFDLLFHHTINSKNDESNSQKIICYFLLNLSPRKANTFDTEEIRKPLSCGTIP